MPAMTSNPLVSASSLSLIFPGALYPLLHSSVTLKKILRKSKIGPMIDSLCTR